MKESGSNPTMKDVAQKVGVALGTVSKVINGIPVGESYRLRVEEAARRLNDTDTEEPFYNFLRRHIQNGRLACDGSFCNVDNLACHIREKLSELGIQVPENVQLILHCLDRRGPGTLCERSGNSNCLSPRLPL